MRSTSVNSKHSRNGNFLIKRNKQREKVLINKVDECLSLGMYDVWEEKSREAKRR